MSSFGRHPASRTPYFRPEAPFTSWIRYLVQKKSSAPMQTTVKIPPMVLCLPKKRTPSVGEGSCCDPVTRDFGHRGFFFKENPLRFSPSTLPGSSLRPASLERSPWGFALGLMDVSGRPGRQGSDVARIRPNSPGDRRRVLRRACPFGLDGFSPKRRRVALTSHRCTPSAHSVPRQARLGSLEAVVTGSQCQNFDPGFETCQPRQKFSRELFSGDRQ